MISTWRRSIVRNRERLAKPSSDDLPFPLHIIPHYVAIQIAAGGEEDAALRALSQAICKTNVLLRLRPAWHEEDVDRDSFAGTHHPLAHRRRFGEWIGRI